MILFDTSKTIYEDELPQCMNNEEYREWFKLSHVEFVRVGPSVIRTKGPSKEKFKFLEYPHGDIKW